MFGGDTAAGVTPFLERVANNRYAQENLSDGLESLRAAYQRASKRRVDPTRDEKVREQLRQAALSITEAGRAIKTGRHKPKPRWGRRLLIVIGAGGIGAAAALATSEQLRHSVFGDAIAAFGDATAAEQQNEVTRTAAEKIPLER